MILRVKLTAKALEMDDCSRRSGFLLGQGRPTFEGELLVLGMLHSIVFGDTDSTHHHFSTKKIRMTLGNLRSLRNLLNRKLCLPLETALKCLLIQHLMGH